MNTGLLILIIVAVAALVLLALWFSQRQRTQRLRQQFGPEYDRTIARTGDQRAAESELAGRAQRRRQLEIVELEPAARSRYLDAWRATQNRFVDDPAGATAEADKLVAQVMRDRGYPVEEFEERAAVISVDHPQVAEQYRAAHTLSLANEKGLAGTDDLRQAFVHYRALFAELLDASAADREALREADEADEADRERDRRGAR
jgi:FtsZ-interacting cell division protein ZipA